MFSLIHKAGVALAREVSFKIDSYLNKNFLHNIKGSLEGDSPATRMTGIFTWGGF